MNRRVILQPTAIRDIDDIITFLVDRSPAGAERWCDRWDEVIATLADDASKFAPAQESERHGGNIRQVMFRTRYGRVYRALFVIEDDTVHVLHVRGPGQDLLPPDGITSP